MPRPRSPTRRSDARVTPAGRGHPRFDTYLAWTAGVVVALDTFAAILVVANDCAAFMGTLLWTLIAAIFVAGMVVPSAIRRVVAPVSARAVKLLVVAAIATAVPAALLSLQHYPNMGHCIA